MRIMSFRVTPVARIYVPTLLLVGAKEMILPVGIVAPLVWLNLNLHLPLPNHFVTGILSAVATSLCYALTGWLTGTAAVLAFNFVARRLGGIDASLLVKEFHATEAFRKGF